MTTEGFIHKDSLNKPSDTLFLERAKRNAALLANFLEESGLGIPVAEVLERGFIIKPNKNLVHASTASASERDEGIAEAAISRVGQTATPIGDHIQTHEMAHVFARDKRNIKPHVLLSDDDAEGYSWRKSKKSGFHYRHRVSGNERTLHYFSALDEALTDTIPLKVIEAKDWAGMYTWMLYQYPRERNMLATMITSMVRHGDSQETEADIFRLFVQSYVLGWQPELKRRLLDTFGPNALRILAIINCPGYVKDQSKAVTLYRKNWWQFWTSHYYDEALVFFDTTRSAEERSTAAQKLLPAEGPLHYLPEKNI